MARKKYKPLPWDSRYLISSCGEVISIHTGKRKKLRLQKHRNGHLRIQIEKKHYPVHRLVLETWVGPQPEEKPRIRHMNDVHSDNRVENLQWGTNKQNSRDAKEIKAKKKEIHITYI